MIAEADIAAVGALIGDRARAAMLNALMGGEPLSAGELARVGGVSPSGATAHLRRLREGGLVVDETAGRQRVFRLAGRGGPRRSRRSPWSRRHSGCTASARPGRSAR